MNLCEKSGVSINKDGRFCSLRMTMFFAGVKKDFFKPQRHGGTEGKTEARCAGLRILKKKTPV
jgi:hypothetical protein